MAQKGISLPINMVVILAVAVLVLVVVAAFFVLQAGGSQQTIRDQDAWATGCSLAISQGCSERAFKAYSDSDPSAGILIPRYDPKGDDPKTGCLGSLGTSGCSDNSLNEACKKVHGLSDYLACRTKCCGS